MIKRGLAVLYRCFHSDFGFGFSLLLLYLTISWVMLASVANEGNTKYLFPLLLKTFSCTLHDWQSTYFGMQEVEGWLWRYWWLKKLLTSAFIYSDSWIYVEWIALIAGSHPETGNVFDLIAISWPLEFIFGDPLYYNLKCLFILGFNGLSGYYLCRELFACQRSVSLSKYLPGETWASFIGGLALCMSSYCLYELANGGLLQAILFPMAFYVMYLLRLWRQPSGRVMIRATLCGGLTSLFYLFYGLSILMFTVFFLTWLVVTGCWGKVNKARFYSFLLLAVLMIFSFLPSGASYIEQYSHSKYLREFQFMVDFPALEVITRSKNPEVLKHNDSMLNSLQRFKSGSLPWVYIFGDNNSHSLPITYMLVLALLLPLVFIEGRRSCQQLPGGRSSGPSLSVVFLQVVPWLIVFFFFYALTLGPYIKVSDEEFAFANSGGIATPYIYLYKYLPCFARLFSPCRMSGMMLVALAWCTALTVQLFFSLTKARWRCQLTVTLIIVWSICLELTCNRTLPIPAFTVNVPDYYYQLANNPDSLTVLEMPCHGGDFVQYYQIIHGKKLFEGWANGSLPVGFPPSPLIAFTNNNAKNFDDNSFYEYLKEISINPDKKLTFTLDDYKSLVGTAGVKRIIVHERGFSTFFGYKCNTMYKQANSELSTLFGPPVHRGVELAFGREMELTVFQIEHINEKSTSIKK